MKIFGVAGSEVYGQRHGIVIVPLRANLEITALASCSSPEHFILGIINPSKNKKSTQKQSI